MRANDYPQKAPAVQRHKPREIETARERRIVRDRVHLGLPLLLQTKKCQHREQSDVGCVGQKAKQQR